MCAFRRALTSSRIDGLHTPSWREPARAHARMQTCVRSLQPFCNNVYNKKPTIKCNVFDAVHVFSVCCAYAVYVCLSLLVFWQRMREFFFAPAKVMKWKMYEMAYIIMCFSHCKRTFLRRINLCFFFSFLRYTFCSYAQN